MKLNGGHIIVLFITGVLLLGLLFGVFVEEKKDEANSTAPLAIY